MFRLVDNADAIAQACKIDLGKGHFEANLMELDFCTNTCIYCCDNLDKWAKDETAADIQLANKLLFPKIRKDPLGCVLIIGYVPSLLQGNHTVADTRSVHTTFQSILSLRPLPVRLQPATPSSSSPVKVHPMSQLFSRK